MSACEVEDEEKIEEITSLNQVDPDSIDFWQPDFLNEKVIYLEERFSNFGDSVEFYEDGTFSLELHTEVLHEHVDLLQRDQAWLPYDSYNAHLLKSGARYERYDNITNCDQFSSDILTTASVSIRGRLCWASSSGFAWRLHPCS